MLWQVQLFLPPRLVQQRTQPAAMGCSALQMSSKNSRSPSAPQVLLQLQVLLISTLCQLPLQLLLTTPPALLLKLPVPG